LVEKAAIKSLACIPKLASQFGNGFGGLVMAVTSYLTNSYHAPSSKKLTVCFSVFALSNTHI
jgi:hypothetical protein